MLSSPSIRGGAAGWGRLALPVALALGCAGEGVLRVRAGKVEQVTVQLGLRDPDAERVEIVAVISAGDTVLLGAVTGTTPGTPVRVGGR